MVKWNSILDYIYFHLYLFSVNFIIKYVHFSRSLLFAQHQYLVVFSIHSCFQCLLSLVACFSMFFIYLFFLSSSSLCQVFESVNYILSPIIFPIYFFKTICSFSFLFLSISFVLPLYLFTVSLLCSLLSASSLIFSVSTHLSAVTPFAILSFSSSHLLLI